ncbi:hypothetical protein GYMLUDRAFT_917099 [Collybiopsis luxurians FD-317 M1]|uniref:Uncharacterized protein n=1 Tax=Collybiopsis luxurians FD-317 M1 TaxID=944289 RepID=A0A0D0CGQ4_9AGAR|nr:hypothetical protein GYMLUDRAFT_917099 [Collybiopsis luxurians FD-317 M1]
MDHTYMSQCAMAIFETMLLPYWVRTNGAPRVAIGSNNCVCRWYTVYCFSFGFSRGHKGWVSRWRMLNPFPLCICAVVLSSGLALLVIAEHFGLYSLLTRWTDVSMDTVPTLHLNYYIFFIIFFI